MSLKAPFIDFSGRKKSVLGDDNINMLASSETAPANNFVGALGSSPLFDVPLNDVGPAQSVGAGAPADDAPRSTATEPTGTGTAGTVSSASTDATTLVAPGATVELSSAYSGIVSFAGATGTLKIDNSSSFTGAITGQLAIGDVIDLADITAGANAKISYSGNNSSGTLTVSDGTNTASIALKGNYSLADFTVSSDGHGGTNVVDPPTVAGFAIGANGLPIIAPQANSHIIYVSSSTGSDSNNGLTQGTAVATIAAGLALLRNGSADQLLLKSGDTFVNQGFGDLTVNGQSATAPILIGTYGTGPAPIVETSPNINFGVGIGSLPGQGGNFVVVEGIDFYSYTRDPNNPAYAGPSTTDQGTSFLNPNTWVMLAGDTFNYYTSGIVFNDGSSNATSSTVTLYKNVVTNSWSTTSHSQGLYVSGVGNLVVEDNIFDHNGWNASIPGAEETIFNRNVYLQGNNGPVIFTGNISANSSSEGAQIRSGGTISGNLFVADSAGFSFGENPGTSSTPSPTITSTVATGNVILNSGGIQSASGLLPRGDGILAFNASGSGSSIQVSGNIIADPVGSTVNQSGISLASNVSGVSATNNIIYGVANPVLNSGTGNTTSPNVINGSGYFDPTRTVESYDANVLGGPGTLTDFLTRAEANPSNPALTAAAVNAYIEAGFALVVEQVTASPTSGVELPGNTITLSLKFGQAVTVTGTPTLTLNDGGTATYTGGSGTTALTFSYTVGATDSSVSALAITQANLPNGAAITDSTGNAVNLSGALVTFTGLQVDPPSGPKINSVVESPSSGDLNAGNTVTFTLNMASAVTVAGGTPTLTLNDGGTASYTGGSGTGALTFSYTVAAGQNTAALAATAVNLNGATVNDGSGNPANFSLTGLSQNGPQIDTTAPTVSSVVASGTGITAGSGDLAAGSVVTLTVNLSSAVTVNTAGGTPSLTLNDGGTATYTGGSGTGALTFSYTVAAGQNTADLAVTAANLNGGTVKDGAGNTANLAGAVTTPSGTLQIDTTTPSVSSVVASGTGISSGSGDLGVGSVVTLTVNLSEAVTVAGGTPTLTLNDGGTATYTGGSGTGALTFSYTVAAGQTTSDLAVTAFNSNSATVKNGAGTAASLSGAVTTPSGTLQIDTTTPTVSSLVASGTGVTAGSGDLGVGSVVTLTVNLSEAVTVSTTGGTPSLTLNDGGTATYTGGSGTNALTFSYTVAAGQNTSDLAVTTVNLNGGTVKDGAGNTANLTGAVTNPAGTLQISTTGPTVSSVAASGTGITAGSGDLDAGSVVTLTVNLSSAVTVNTTGGTPSLTLNDGGTATYTGGSGTGALTFSYTVAAGQTTSDLTVTAVNLNGATVKDGAGNAANLTGAVTNPAGTLQIDTTAPTVSSVVATGTGITAGSGDLAAGSVVTLTVNLSSAVTVNTTGGTPSLTLNDGGTATYTGGSGTGALTFSYTVAAGQNTADLAVTAANLNGGTVKDGAGNTANLAGAVTTPSGTLQIDATTPTLSSVTETPSNGHLKAGKTVTLTLNMSEAVTVSGGVPTLTLNDGATATYTGGSGTNALTFSYTVAAGQNAASLAATTINLNGATIKNGAGTAANLSTLSGLTQVGAQIDTTIPTVTQVVASPGSGIENPGDVITLTVDLSKAVTVTGTPTLSLNDGATATYTGGSGTNALTFSYTVAATDSTVPTLAITQANLPSGATILDEAGNAANLSGAVTTFPGLSIDPPPVVVSVTETPSTGDLNSGKTVTLTLRLNDVVTVTGGAPTLALNDGGTATYTGGSGTNALTFTYTVGAGQNTASLAATGLTLNGASVQNSLGNAAIFSFNGVTQTGPQIDTTPPTVTSVAASGAGITAGTGDLPAGSVVTLTLNMDEAVTVGGGTPTLTLNDGGTATYTSGSGTNTLTFSYTVAGGQSTADLAVTAINLGTATVKDGAGNAANLSGAVTSPAGTLQIDGVTTNIAQVGSDYFLDNINGSGPELKQGGAAVTTGEFAGWAPIAAVEVAGGGYDVAWKNTATAQYTVWSTDSSGNYLSDFIVPVSGNSTALESIETTFNQDLNGDGTIGLTTVVIQTDGSTALTDVGNNFFLNNTGTGTGPELKQSGVAVTSGEFGTWTPIGAVQVTGGDYDVAWKNTATGQYTVWSTDSSGNYLSDFIVPVAGNNTTLESLETTFNQDLNGDGTVGIRPILIQTDGSTALTEVGNNFFLNNTGTGTGPELKQSGVAVTSGEFGTWTPIGAVQVTGGDYDVAWKNTATGQYTVWSTDSSGNYLSDFIVPVAGNNTTLESLETIFNQDLNGDGTIGIPTVVIQTDGSTALTEVGNNFFLDNTGSGTGPELKQSGVAVTSGEFGTWTPVGAVQVAGGDYDVAWKNTTTGQYTVWSTDSNGNYLSDFIAPVSGNSTAFETLENTFQQDLNGDGVIGIYAAPGTTLQISNPLTGPSGSATIGAGATLELAAANSSSVAFTSSTGALELDQPSTFDGVIFGFAGNGTLAGSDQIDLKGINFNSVHDSYSNGVLTVTDGTNSAALDFNGSYVLANFKFASDGKGGTIVYDPPVAAGQGGSLPPQIMQDPGTSALNQQVALFSQQIAAAFPSSSSGDGGASTIGASEISSAQFTQISTPIATQQHT